MTRALVTLAIAVLLTALSSCAEEAPAPIRLQDLKPGDALFMRYSRSSFRSTIQAEFLIRSRPDGVFVSIFPMGTPGEQSGLVDRRPLQTPNLRQADAALDRLRTNPSAPCSAQISVSLALIRSGDVARSETVAKSACPLPSLSIAPFESYAWEVGRQDVDTFPQGRER